MLKLYAPSLYEQMVFHSFFLAFITLLTSKPVVRITSTVTAEYVRDPEAPGTEATAHLVILDYYGLLVLAFGISKVLVPKQTCLPRLTPLFKHAARENSCVRVPVVKDKTKNVSADDLC